jgi:hypothetical protein
MRLMKYLQSGWFRDNRTFFCLAHISHKLGANMVKRHIERYHHKRGSVEERKHGSFSLALFRAYDLTCFIISYRIQNVFESLLAPNNKFMNKLGWCEV